MSATQSYLQRQAKVFFCEFFGTALVLAIGCMGCTESFGPVFQGPTNEALTFSIATMTATRIFVHFSGGHVNPSITLVSVLVQMTPIWLAPSYFAGQFTGALAGFALLNATVSGNNEGNKLLISYFFIYLFVTLVSLLSRKRFSCWKFLL